MCLAQFSIQGPSDGHRRAQGLKFSQEKGIEYTEASGKRSDKRSSECDTQRTKVPKQFAPVFLPFAGVVYLRNKNDPFFDRERNNFDDFH